jgi:hypothetical protein
MIKTRKEAVEHILTSVYENEGRPADDSTAAALLLYNELINAEKELESLQLRQSSTANLMHIFCTELAKNNLDASIYLNDMDKEQRRASHATSNS